MFFGDLFSIAFPGSLFVVQDLPIYFPSLLEPLLVEKMSKNLK
jgi:hypothetical protein